MSTTAEHPELFGAMQDDHQRRELVRDIEAAGYSPGDAGRLADRIIGGWLLPGLASSPPSKRFSSPGRLVVGRESPPPRV
jgi:hypothetical protein